MGWRLPPLNQLRAFEATARTGSMTRAARELLVTQVAVTRQIATLEQHLRVKLFLRGNRQVRMTPAGESFFLTVTRVFRELQDATEGIGGHADRPVLKILGYSNFTMRWLIPRLGAFHARHPEIDLQLTSSMEAVDFERSDFDAAIRSGHGAWPHWSCLALAPIDLMPVCSPLLLQGPTPLRSPADLAHHTLLHSVARPGDWAIWLSSCGERDVTADGGIRFDNGSLAYQAAIEGVGVAIAQRVLVLDDLRSGKLAAPFEHLVRSGESYYFVTPPNRLSPKVRAFRDWLRTIAQQVDGARPVGTGPVD